MIAGLGMWTIIQGWLISKCDCCILKKYFLEGKILVNYFIIRLYN
jgi:hypothetical protein